MKITYRTYQSPQDYQLVDQFLIQHYQPGNADRNWVEPAWEYMHYHPLLDSSALDKIGLWEDGGNLVAIAHFEWSLGEAFFQFHPGYRHLREQLLDYAEEYLFGRSKTDGRNYLRAYINDHDLPFTSLVEQRGYHIDHEEARPMAKFEIPQPFPPIELPEGFRLKSLADDCDWVKVNRVLYRGFNHSGEPPASPQDIEERRIMFDTPKARRDLKIVVEAPDGEFASFCGMFYEPTHRYAYVEPVATDPTYRRLGLGKAAVLEGIRRCSALGATTAYVGSDQKFYLSMGFKVNYTSQCWLKYLDDAAN